MIVKLKDKLGLHLYDKDEVEFTPGLTYLVGCNGSGKTSLINEIESYCKDNDITVVHLDCDKEFHLTGDINDIDTSRYDLDIALNKFFSSEHEHYEAMFGSFVKTIRPGDEFEDKKFVVLIDGLDSGGDVVYYQTHTSLYQLMVNDAINRGIEFYLIVTCNNFYYLSKTKKGRIMYIPSLDVVELPRYESTEFDKYIEDIRKSARDRGFSI